MVNGLATAFIANDSTNSVLVSSALNGQSWLLNTSIGQASDGTAPSLAEFNGQLWVAFVANNSTHSVLVCSSPDGVHWSANHNIGQASQSAPSLAAFGGRLWVAFIADNSTNTDVVSSWDGNPRHQWSPNTSIGQASDGTAPSLAELWVAFVANNSTHSVLVCSSPDGVHWSANHNIGQASQSAPSLAAFGGRLWVAFIADNSTNTVLVSSWDGNPRHQWSPNTNIGQASDGTAPSLAAFGGQLWVAFVANNSTHSVLVSSSPDGVDQWSSNIKIGQTSQSAPSLAAFDNFSLVACPAATPAAVPVPAPASGLGSNSNYILYSDCQPLLEVSVSICVTEDIVSNNGFGFQLNAYSPKNETSAYQQYAIVVEDEAEITGIVNNYGTSNNALIFDSPRCARWARRIRYPPDTSSRSP